MSAELGEMALMTRRFSPERLTPYVIAVGGDTSAALELYGWNAEVSAALSRTIGHVEVILRNAIHESLTNWSMRQFAEPAWYLDAGHVFQTRATQDIRTARQRAVRSGRREEAPGRVVAELNLGFWRYLLANYYDACRRSRNSPGLGSSNSPGLVRCGQFSWCLWWPWGRRALVSCGVGSWPRS